MKLPASLADLGLALLVAYALRDRPRWAAIGAAAILLHPGRHRRQRLVGPVRVDLRAVRRWRRLSSRSTAANGLAAALVAAALMTKPQALPFLLPFAAWFWATGGCREIVRAAAAIGLAVIVVLWLPFIPAGGPADYLTTLAEYQSDIFPILSLRAWNLWWLVQEVAAGGEFVADDVAFLGPLTLRHVGYVITGVLSVLVAIAIVRDPRPRTLILGLAASTWSRSAFLTQMHERYAYGALVLPDAAARQARTCAGSGSPSASCSR